MIFVFHHVAFSFDQARATIVLVYVYRLLPSLVPLDRGEVLRLPHLQRTELLLGNISPGVVDLGSVEVVDLREWDENSKSIQNLESRFGRTLS